MTTVTPSTGINNTPAEGLRKGRSSHEEVSLPTNASHFFPILTNVQNPQPSPIQPSEAMQRIVLPQLIPLLLRPPSLPTDREILSPSPAAQMPQQQVMASVVVLPDSEGGAGNDEHQQNGVEPSDSSSIAAVHPEQRREATMPSLSSSSSESVSGGESSIQKNKSILGRRILPLLSSSSSILLQEEEYALRARHKRAVEVVENGTSSSSEKTVDNGTDAETTNTSTTANITNNVALWRVAGTRLSARLPSPFFAYSPYAPQQRAPPVLVCLFCLSSSVHTHIFHFYSVLFVFFSHQNNGFSPF
jgi:hypothetical protein